jgi:hypothetical protein
MWSSEKYVNGSLVGALMTVVLLAGCAGGSRPGLAPTPSASPAASEAPQAAPDVAVGEFVTAEQAETLGEGLAAYELADGTSVVVGAGEPLPAQVADDLTAELAATVSGHSDGRILADVSALVTSASKSTGKNVLMVYLNPLSSLGDEEPHPMWATHGQPQDTRIQSTNDYDSQIANVEAFIASRPDPSAWVYIVQPR